MKRVIKKVIGIRQSTETFISDGKANRVLEVGKDRTLSATEELLKKTFTSKQLTEMKVLCVDMWDPFIAAVKKKCSDIEIVHDKFHVVKYLNKGIDETPKKEVKIEPLLKKSKYVMLKNSDKLTDKQRAKFMEINQANLLTARAWKMKENFMEIFEKQTIEQARTFFDSW